MKTYRASRFRSELHEIVTDILDDIDFQELHEADEPDVVIMDAMESVDRASLTDVEDALRDYDEPNELIDSAEDNYDKALKNLVLGFISAGAIALIAASLPLGDTSLGLEALVGMVFAISSINAAEAGYSAWKDEQAVDRAIRNYKDDY